MELPLVSSGTVSAAPPGKAGGIPTTEGAAMTVNIEVIVKCSKLTEAEDVMRALGALACAPKEVTVSTTRPIMEVQE